MEILDLDRVEPGMLPLVGGKAIGLAMLIAAGERVPPGFCLTTEAHRAGAVPRDAVVERWRTLLDGTPVAVRSSATAEDLPDASFAGQQDTILGVTTADGLIAAIERCWASLDDERAASYRASRGIEDAAMGVVVQRMVDARAAGVLFTADPVGGTRSRQVVDVAPGLGEHVVDGSVTAEHAELDDGVAPRTLECVTADELAELQRVGRRIERAAGTPQDIEFAFDAAGTLWLLQSRAITTLFPVPDVDGLRAYLDVGHTQGMLQPMTPMGQSVMLRVTADAARAFSLPIDRMLTFIGGRMFFDLTDMLRSRVLRPSVPRLLHVYGPGAQAAGETLMADERLRPHGMPSPWPAMLAGARMLGTTARFMGPVVTGVVQALRDPAEARRRAHAAATIVQVAASTPEEHLAAARDLQRPLMEHGMWAMTPTLYGAIAAREIGRALLRGIASPGDVDRTQRGMPHNPTTEMDLALWRVAERAAEHRELLTSRSTHDLVDLWRHGSLPEIGLDAFLERYGHRCAAEIDVGVARWAEDPAPVLAALVGYLDIVGTEAAPDRRFALAAAEAEAAIDEIVAAARAAGHPLRAGAAGWLLHRSRELAGLRELPKFVWVTAIREVREHLLAVGDALVGLGAIDDREDVCMLDLDEASAALHGQSVRERIDERRAVRTRELRRTQVPALLLSDGTVVRPSAAPDDDAIVGTAAAAGTATGRARVVRDPSDARIEPGEILVAPTTDPGWTPLFMTAGGLVTETGSPMAHGPTVAREYGIPAVIGVRDATTRIATGDLLTIDGSAGTVHIDEPAEQAPLSPDPHPAR